MKWLISIILFILMLNFASAIYTPPSYTNVTIVLKAIYTPPSYTNVTIILGEIGGNAPVITFLSQRPADITITNLQVNKLFINYSVTSATLNDTSVKLFYKSNDTLDNTMFYLNGTARSGYFDDSSLSPRTNISENYTWTLLDNEVYPGTYNTDPVSIDNKVHDSISTTNTPANQYYVKTQYYNISNSSNWGYFEIMANSTATANPSRVYYCNSSYTTGRIDTSSFCVLTATRNATTTFDHCHTNSSCHLGFQFAINRTSGRIGNVVVTSTSWFIFGGADNWRVYNIPETTRAGMTLSTTNRGTAWSSQTYTVDEHLHQFDTVNTNTTFYYYACANDTDGTSACSSVREDLMAYAGLPPDSPQVYAPTGVYKLDSLISINYTASESPNEYAIAYYNVSLLNSDFSFNQTIKANNSQDLGYIWNSTGMPVGTYIVQVQAFDVLNQSSLGYSDEFFIENISMDYTVNLPLGFIRYLNCSPDFENPQSQPEGQSPTVWALNVTNNGNITEDMQIRINPAAATGWRIYSSNSGDLSSPTLFSTTYQTILSAVGIGETKSVWLYANCSFINSNSRTNIEMRGV